MSIHSAALTFDDFSTSSTAREAKWHPPTPIVRTRDAPPGFAQCADEEVAQVSASGAAFLLNYEKFFRTHPRCYETTLGDTAIEFNSCGRVTLIVTSSKLICFDERPSDPVYQEIPSWPAHPSLIREFLEKL